MGAPGMAEVCASPLDRTAADSSLHQFRQALFTPAFHTTAIPSAATLDDDPPDGGDGTPAPVPVCAFRSTRLTSPWSLLPASRRISPPRQLYCLFCTLLI